MILMKYIIPTIYRSPHLDRKPLRWEITTHNWTAARNVTLQSYIESVCQVLEEKIRTLVYLAAFLIPNGKAMLPAALSDSESLIVSNLEVNEEQGSHMLKAEAFRKALYADCTD